MHDAQQRSPALGVERLVLVKVEWSTGEPGLAYASRFLGNSTEALR